MSDGSYIPATKVDWTSTSAFAQFQLWRKEVERIIGGPLANKSNPVKVNHIFIWAGAHAESLIEAKKDKDPSIDVSTPVNLLDQLQSCLTHCTFFREVRCDFYNVHQMAGENTTTFFSRIMDLYRQAEFPEGSLFLVTDRLIHRCSNKEAKKKLMLLEKEVTIKQCLDVLKKQEALEASLKRIEDAEDVRVEASFARLRDRDPTRQSQRNGARRQQPRPQPSRQRSAGMPDFPCSWCDAETQHPRHLCPARHAVCQFCGKDGHFERACFRKRATQHQHAVDISLNPEQYYCEDDLLDLQSLSVDTTTMQSEVYAPLTFHVKGTAFETAGKVDTGAMVSCMPLSMIPKFGLTQSDLTPSNAIIRGISGADLVNCGTVKADISCNGITAGAEFYVTRANSTLVLGLEFCRKFELVAIAPVCTHPAEAAHRAKLHQWTKQLVMWTQDHLRTEPSVESFAEHLLRKINSMVKNPVVEKVETIGSVACPLPHGQHPVPVWPVLHSGSNQRPFEPLRPQIILPQSDASISPILMRGMRTTEAPTGRRVTFPQTSDINNDRLQPVVDMGAARQDESTTLQPSASSSSYPSSTPLSTTSASSMTTPVATDTSPNPTATQTPTTTPGRVDGKVSDPDSYWIVSQNNGRRVRRTLHNMKPIYHGSASPYSARQSLRRPSSETSPAEGEISTAPAVNPPVAENRRGAVELTPEAAAAEARTSTRQPKPQRDLDFVYS